MDTQRIILLAAFLMVSMMLWQSWQVHINPPAETTATQTGSNPISSTAKDSTAKDVPNLPNPSTDGKPALITQAVESSDSGERIKVKTDLLNLEFSTKGADVRKVALLDYPVDVNTDKTPVVLMNDLPDKFFVTQTGILTIGDDKSYAPDHTAVFSTAKSSYEMGENDTLNVAFSWTSADGKLKLSKTYTFTRGSYAIKVNQKVENNTGNTWQGYFYRQIQRNNNSLGGANMFIHTYTGGMLFREGGGFEKYGFDDMVEEKLERSLVGGWAAMIEHYFLAAWVPQKDNRENYYSRVNSQPGLDTRYIIGLTSPAVLAEDGKSIEVVDQLVIGPKLQNQLKEIAPFLDDTVDYGFLSVIAHPIFWVIDNINNFVQNWGWSIILLTLFIKAIFYKLSEYSYRSMAQMRKVGPKLKAIQDQHKDNPEAKNQAMMKLYKTEKINPLGGCLPILIQIPVFIALYWVLLESVELRQADWILWLNNLSVADPYYVLPLVMGATMFIQQKLNPAPLDPIQAKVMMMLPIIFTVFFAFFPAGLVLYWVTNNILSIAQQWYITQKIEASSNPKKA